MASSGGVGTAEPAPNDLYVPPERARTGPQGALVWDVMRLCISKPGAIWCTVCRTWYKYGTNSMPSLVHHCTTAHNSTPIKPPVPQPPPGPSANGPPLPSPVAPTPPIAAPPPTSPIAPPPPVRNRPTKTSPRPVAAAVPPPPAPVAPSVTPPVATTASPPGPQPAARSVGVMGASATASNAPVTAAGASATAPNAASAPASAPSAPAGAGGGVATAQRTERTTPGAAGGVAKRRQLTRAIAAPAAVRAVAERCQEMLFESTGMTFFNAKFQVPRSKEEALSVIRGGIRDMEKSDDSRKLYFLGWAHSQIFSAEMAALGYRFITAGIRCDTSMTKPPPLEAWLTLELPLRPGGRKKPRAKGDPPKAPAPNNEPPPPPAPPPQPDRPERPERPAQPSTPQKEKNAAPAAQASTDSPRDVVRSPESPRKPAGKVIDTIDLT